MDLKLASGEPVIDRLLSHVHGEVAALLPAALAKVKSGCRQFFVEEVDFGRPIGETVCVVTGPGDEIVYAKRPGRWGHTRFVKNRQPEKYSSFVVILKKAEENDVYILITAFVGHRPEPEPWDRNATEKSREFWNTHALVWGSEPTIPGAETSQCPW